MVDSSAISLPQGGGALSGIGEKFSPDMHTGTGNFSVPIELLPGRNGFHPSLSLVYSTGNGNGCFGLGWGLTIPEITRKTSSGVPLYNESASNVPSTEKADTFVLSGAEDLIAVSGEYPNEVVYRPRTEGLFARITHHKKDNKNYWKVESKGGLTSTYGNQETLHGTLRDPDHSQHVFSWKLTETKDTFGNRIIYDYEKKPSNRDEQLLLKRIRYVDYGDSFSNKFLVHVDFIYEERPDAFSNFRSGFEVRNSQRCKAIQVSTLAEDGEKKLFREYRFVYKQTVHNGMSLLQKLDIIGFDDDGNVYEHNASPFSKQLPPLTFDYSEFSPEQRKFNVVSGRDFPTKSLSSPDMDLVDLHGCGLPDILEMGITTRYWRNLGSGKFDMPRPMKNAPPHSLAENSTQIIDANGDGKADLLVYTPIYTGYYPLEHGARWSRDSFQIYSMVPNFNLNDANVKLVDVSGDGYTDILRTGNRLECYFNDPDSALAWQRTHFASRKTITEFPDVDFSDQRIRLADMTGDGLQDIVFINDGNIEYWPNLGHNRWGSRISMQTAPRYRETGYPFGYDPKRLLLGDVDGDGLADLIYVENDRVLLWINQSGNGWSVDPIIINGTPLVNDLTHLRLVDLYGTGVSGVLWNSDAHALNTSNMMFLDFTGSIKPYLLNKMDNHMGAITHVEYKPSTHYFLKDQKKLETQWRTPLPFPVQVVANVKVVDAVSKGKLTTEYRYHHGYWDGAEREFRGFGLVEQFDTEAFTKYHDAAATNSSFKAINEHQFSAPTLTKTWFHQGAVGDEFGDWDEVDYTHEYWQGDPQLLEHTEQVNTFLKQYNDRGHSASAQNRRIKRDALRTLRGSILRTELYALDGSERENKPYTVTEHAYDLEELAKSNKQNRHRIFFPHLIAQRTTQWERGDDPMTQFELTSYRSDQGTFDEFGRPQRQTTLAMPRLTKHQRTVTGTVVGSIHVDETHILATQSRTQYAEANAAQTYIHDRLAQAQVFELINPPAVADTLTDTAQEALQKQWQASKVALAFFDNLAHIKLIAHELQHYDGDAFIGLPAGVLDEHGALMRSEALVFQDEHLNAAYKERRPSYLTGTAMLPSTAPDITSKQLGYRQEYGSTDYVEGYYTNTTRQKLSTRGMPIAIKDALSNETTIVYDDYDLLPIKTTDAVGLETIAKYNYRLLQPVSMTDSNGTTTHITYNPIGLPAKQYSQGQDAGIERGGTEDKPDISFDYHLRSFEQTQQPAFVHTTRRIHHANDASNDDTIETREYSDGFGRLIQTRAQAEEMRFGKLGDDVGLTPDTSVAATEKNIDDSVVVSGWEVFDNKGQVVEKHEPFYSLGWVFQAENDAKKGQHVSQFYDPRGQVIRTLNPDGSQQRIVYGFPQQAAELALTSNDLITTDVPANFRPSTWESYTYDSNDLAELTTASTPATAQTALSHYYTPASIHVDALGRAICTIVRNGSQPEQDWFVTRSEYDIRGNQLTVYDTLARAAFRYEYDLSNRTLSVDSIDAGWRTSVLNALESVIEARDSKGSLSVRTYDALNRPKQLWAQDNDQKPLTLRESVQYGDEGNRVEARQHNSLGKPVSYYDEAGLVEINNYDFKGNVLEKSRRTIRDEVLEEGWQADWSQPNADEQLEEQVYSSNSQYDALNRPTVIIYPEDVSGQRKKLIPGYNRAGALNRVKLDDAEYIQHIAYNAKGQRILLAYGNGLMTRYTYDEQTFRLARLRTERFTLNAGSAADEQVWQGNTAPIQDFLYRYDLVGNITEIEEQTENCGIQNSGLGKDRLLREFTYDPIYRLLSATGRVCQQMGMPSSGAYTANCGFYSSNSISFSQSNAPEQTEFYSQTYAYDSAGNMLSMTQQADHSQWKRQYGMGGLASADWQDTQNNRLTSLNTGTNNPEHQYAFDANGNLLSQNTSKQHEWDYADRMIGCRETTSQGNIHSIDARYLYGADGMRVKKWVKKSNRINTTTYVDGVFEQHRTYKKDTNATVTDLKTNNTLHVMDGENRIAMVRAGEPLSDKDVSPAIQFHLGDHLGSSHTTVGGDNHNASTFINREEYFPYGETSLGSFSKKRYRYSGKERDEESGLYYYGARYLAPWLARWMSCDPIGERDGLNIYKYVHNNPINLIDKEGFEARFVGFVEDTSGDVPKGDIPKEHSFLKEIIQGDSYEGESTAVGTAGNIIVGFIPIVGQLADIRDTYVAAKKVYNDPESASNWTELGIAIVGFIPAGDVLKATGKGGKRLLKEGSEEASQRLSKVATKERFPTKFHKRSVEEVAQLRKKFESIKPEFVRSYANSAEAAKRFTPQQIAKMIKSGKVPKGFVIHHKKPLFRGGDNSFDNFRVMNSKFHQKHNKRLHWYNEGENIYQK